MTNLKGKVAIVTGAAVGLGREYAVALAEAGVNLALCDLRDEVHELPALLGDKGVSVVASQGDVADPDHVRAVVDGAVDALGGIDILINNAGVWGASSADDGLEKSIADYELIIGTNLKGEYLMGRAVIAELLKQGRGGDIVNVATDHMVTCGSPFELCPKLEACTWKDAPRPTGGGEVMDLYDASKWGLNGFLFGWAKALRSHGIRVNAMCMGATDSWMIRDFYGYPQSRDEENEEQAEEVATWMAKEDTAQVVVNLLKEGPEGRTAQNINLCVGRPTVLEPPLPNKYITEESLNGRA